MGNFVADGSTGFPNFFPIGIYTTHELAIKEVEAFPRDRNYQILRMPLNNNFAYYHKTSVSWLGWIRSIMNILISRMKVKTIACYAIGE